MLFTYLSDLGDVEGEQSDEIDQPGPLSPLSTASSPFDQQQAAEKVASDREFSAYKLGQGGR